MVEESGAIGQERPRQWDYDTHFREYMLLLGRKGSEGLESIDRYPDKIALNAVWHGTLDQMRAETMGDGHERYGLITYDETAREFQFPQTVARGTPDAISAELARSEFVTAKNELRITGVVGDIHTHPDADPFTPRDLYNTINRFREPQTLVSGLATSQENIFVFRTQETITVTPLDLWPKDFVTVFEDHWLNRAGYRFDEKRTRLIPIAKSPWKWAVSFGVAKKYHLALYKGSPGADLVRLSPKHRS